MCENNQCICEEGWIGNGDFIFGSPACQLNVIAVKAIYGLLTCTNLINIIFTFFFLFRKFLHLGRRKPRVNCVRFIREKGVFIGFCSLFASGFLSSLGLIRITNPFRTIGTDVTCTLMFVLGSVFFWTFLLNITEVFLVFLSSVSSIMKIEDRSRIQSAFKQFYRYKIILWIFAPMGCIAPLFMLTDPGNPNIMFAFAAIHFLSLGFEMAFLSYLGEASLKPLIRELESLKQPSLNHLKEQFRKFTFQVRIQRTVQSLTAIIFGLWPYVQRYSAYELPLAWSGAGSIMLFGMYSIFPRVTELSQIKSAGDEQVSSRS